MSTIAGRKQIWTLLFVIIILVLIAAIFTNEHFYWMAKNNLEEVRLHGNIRTSYVGRNIKGIDDGKYCEDCEDNNLNITSNNDLMINKWKSVSKLEINSKILQTRKWFRKGCPQPFIPGKMKPKSFPIAIRKEYRTLTNKERQRFHDCLLKMTKTPAIEPFWDQSEYESFVTQHRYQFSPQAHGSPAFAPYHRVYLFYFEKVLRNHDGCEDVGLPYWDTTLDSFLPDPSMSAMFTDESYIGNSKGEINKGFMANGWTIVKIPMCIPYGRKLARAMCKDRFQMMTDEMIQEFVRCPNFEHCVSPHNTSFEENHGLIHGCLGGHMKELICSPYDPLFYLHHSFIDLIFDLFLAEAFPDYDVDAGIAYPDDKNIDIYYQRGSEPMRPFEGSGLKVRDGMSRNFSRDFYNYHPRPFHCTKPSDCHSKILWCDLKAERCKAKVGEDGDCTGLSNEACHCRLPGERPICSPTTFKCECIGGKDSKKRKDNSSYEINCSTDNDCKIDEWCRLKTCEKKLVIAEECGNLPDNACSPNTSLERTGNRSVKPCGSFENPRCLRGYCACSLMTIRCDPANPNCNSIHPELWCDPGSSLCLYRKRPGDGCEKFDPREACGYCGEKEFGLCSKNSKKCICLNPDNLSELF